jgi:hypothetical protein
VADDCGPFAESMRGVLDCPVETFSLSEIPAARSGNLLPPGWATEANRLQRAERVKQRLLIAAFVYLLLIAGAFLYLAWTKRQLQVLDVQIAKTKPLIEATQARQQRWEALAPAIDPGRYVVEIAWLVFKSRPGPEVHITQLDCNPSQFMVEGEAPSAAAAIDFLERLKAEQGLSAFKVESPTPPVILPNETAQFRIFGKL